VSVTLSFYAIAVGMQGPEEWQINKRQKRELKLDVGRRRMISAEQCANENLESHDM
jgi:hypothetical protein